jgi:hypothetical protein
MAAFLVLLLPAGRKAFETYRARPTGNGFASE